MNQFTMNAWREILKRIFEGFETRDDFSPSWMTNPITGRRLKLDRYYPELGIAIRFVGLQGRQNYRLSEEEEQAQEVREDMRDWLCRQQGVTLISVDVNEPEPARVMARLRTALSRAARLLAQSNVEGHLKQDLAPRIAQAQRRCDHIASQLRHSESQ